RRGNPSALSAPPSQQAFQSDSRRQRSRRQRYSLPESIENGRLRVNLRFAWSRRTPNVGAVSPEVVGAAVVLDSGIENLAANLVTQVAGSHRKQDLDPMVEIARHPIGGGRVEFLLALGSERKDTIVL